MTTRLREWLLNPLPLARVAALRVIVYAFVPLDVFVNSAWIKSHADLPTSLYQPLLIGRLLHLPVPTSAFVHTTEYLLLAASVAAVVGAVVDIAPRLLGGAVAVVYLEWMVIAMSYGKVDHDRFAYLVALAVLPTVGHAGLRDERRTAAAGWALRCVQVAVVATYFLASVAKLRYAGPRWVDSAVLEWAIIRRGTPLGTPLLHHPELLLLAQWGIVAFELSSPVVLFLRRYRWRLLAVGFFLAFHVVTDATISILFTPHLICLLAFLPLERVLVSTAQTSKRPGSLSEAPTSARNREPSSPSMMRWSNDSAS